MAKPASTVTHPAMSEHFRGKTQKEANPFSCALSWDVKNVAVASGSPVTVLAFRKCEFTLSRTSKLSSGIPKVDRHPETSDKLS